MRILSTKRFGQGEATIQGVRRSARRQVLRRRKLEAEWLERRLALAAIPTATVSGGTGALIGQEIPLTVTFDNTATNPADIGYAPFVNIVMPATGDAPPTPNDGIAFKPNSATYNGLSLTTNVLTFNAQGKATHPFAKNPDGTSLVVSGKPGDQLVVVQLPFGSYGPEQPAAEINFTGVISPLAQPNASYPVTATGGFQFQTDASGNPTVNVATIGTPTTDPIEPQLFRLKKTSSAPESETATGPNFKHTYTVSMAVAPGQTVNDLLLADVLPTNIQFVSVNTVAGNGSTTITPVATPSTSTPGGTLSRRFDKVVGTGSDSDAVMTFTYFVPQDDAAGIDVIPLGTGGTAIATNLANATGTWTSANPNFPNPQTVESDPDDANAQHTLTARTVALQKSVVDLTNPGSPRAGDLVEYTLNFQVSDYFALENFNVADILSDGQEFDASFTPTLTFTQKSETFTAQPFAGANFTVAVQADGSTNVDFDVSAQLQALGLTTGGKLVGAGIPNTGTGSPSTLPDPLPGGPGTTGTIKFRARVLNEYRATPRPGADVVQGDVMTNEADTTATVLAFANLDPTSSTVSDGSSTSFTLVSGAATKSVFAINGVPASGTPVVTAGDAVTFRITYNLPFSSIKDYRISDFLPLPIFAAQNLSFAGGSPSASVPAAGQWKYGPTDTYAAISGITPTTSANTAANSVTWNFGTFEDSLNRSAVTDILFTVTATNRPFADGLLLTNQAEQTERNETGDVLTSNTALAQVKIAEPLLGITKGVVSTNNAAGVFTPTLVSPAGVTFSQPGVAGAAFTGTITSGGLASTPINSTLSNVLGNDLVKFCIIVQNTGSGPNGAFEVKLKDVFDATKMRIPANATGLNLKITDGTGASLPFTGSLFSAGGITLVDPSASAGSLDPGKTTAGATINTGGNIAVITYDLQLLPSVAPLDVITNTATLTNYASQPGGPNFLPPAGLSDTATVTVMAPQVTKTLRGTSIVDAFNSNTQGVIGEIVTFDLKVDVPRGTTPNAVVVDSLPPGLAFKDFLFFERDALVSFTGSPTPVVTNQGRTLTLNLGDITNAQTSQDRAGILFSYTAVVLNVSSNRAGTQLTNDAKLTWTGHNELPAAKSAPVTVIEPKLTIDKSVTPTTAQASDTVTFTIVVAASQTTAHNVAISDIFPWGFTYIPGTLRNTAGVVPTTLAAAAGGTAFDATYTQLTPGQTSTLQFQARITSDVISGRTINNVATETWTSLPGNPGQITPFNPNAYERTGSESTTQGQLNNYKTSDAATVTLASPTLTKALVTTSIVNASNTATQAVIGETATYTVTMKIPQGRTPGAQLIDTLGPGMAYVRTISVVNDDPAVLTVPGLNSPPVLTNNGTTATWSLGDIVNTDTNSATDETITFTIEAVVLNVNSNLGGVNLVNRVEAVWDKDSQRSPRISSGPVTVIEPRLQTTKSVAVGGFGGNVGDPVTYTIVVQQAPTSNTDAFNVTLRDVIPASIASPSLTGVVDTAGVVTTANFSLTGNTLATTGAGFDLPKLPAGRTITLTVTGTLAGPVTANQQITNTNQIQWTSLSGTPGQITPNNPNAYERTGSGSTSLGQLNNYVTTSSASFTVNTADLAVVKTVNNPSPNVGDTITFTVTVSNLGPNTAHAVQVTDRFPTTGLQLLSATPSQGTFDQTTGIWTVGTVATGAGNAKTLTLTALVLAPAVNTIPAAQTNVATVTNSAEPDPNPGNNTGTATETPRYADLGVTKTTSNVQPNVGETFTYTVSLYNLGTSAATNVEVTDTLPANVTIVSATPSAGAFNTGTKVWSIPSVPTTNGVANPLTLLLTVQATASGASFNTVTITKSDVWDPNDNNNTAKTPTDPQEADLVVSKTVDNPTPNVGDDVTFTITLDNLGPSAAQNVVVTDLLPAGLQYVSHSASTGTYVPGTGVWTVGTLLSDQFGALTIVATVTAPSPGPAPARTNTATATSTTTDPNPDNNTDSSTVTPKQADLAIVKVVDDPTPKVGNTITFDIGVANYGPDTATNVIVNDRLPTGVTFVSASATQGTYDQVTGIWTVGTVGTADFPILSIVVTVDRPTSGIPPAVTNTATVSGTEYDPDLSNNTDSATETPQYADLKVTKTVSDARPNVGDTITFTITLSNLGRDPASGVTVLDLLPPGLQFVSASNSGTYDELTGIWTVPGPIDTLSTRTLSIQAIVLPPTSGNPLPLTNTASVATSDQYDPDPSNNTASATETPQYADVAVRKLVDNPNPNVGGQVTFTVEVTNNGVDPATGVTIQDLLPSGLTFVSASAAAGTSYNPATGVWTVNSLPVNASKLLTIVAGVAVSGSFTNVAAVTRADQYDPNPGNNRGEATVNTREADLAVVKTVNDSTPNVGDTITFTVTLSNDGPDAAHNVEVTERFPAAGLQFLSATPSQGTYNSGTGIWTVGTVALGESKTLTILARVLAPAVNTIPLAQTNVATVTKSDEYDPNPGNNTGSVTETPQYADLGVKKTTNNVQPNVGETITYTVTLFNLGTAVATNVEVTDALPANVAFVSATPASGTRFGETATGGVWSVPSIAPGQTLVLTLVVEATNTSVAFNTATITHSDVWDPNDRNNTARTPTDPQQADLIVSKTADNSRPNVGDNVTFTITLENLGPSAAQAVSLTDTLPAGLQFVSATPSTGTFSGGVWTLGTVASGATPTLSLVAKVLAPPSGPVSPQQNSATATSTTPDPDPENNTGTSTVTPKQADLEIFKTVNHTEPSIGETIEYTLVVNNLGTDTATNVVVRDLLPAGLTFVSAIPSPGFGAYDVGTGIWTVGTVTTADTPSLVISAKVTRPTGGTVTNTATVSATEYDPDPSNNTSTAEILVPASGVIVGTDIGCITGPFVRVVDPDTGADRIIPFFAYEPSFRGGARVYGADVTGDGIPEIITAPGPGRPAEVRVFSDTGSPLPQYNFFPFGRGYTGGLNISAGSITAAGTIQIVAAQSRGGTVRVFDVTPSNPTPVASTPIRQLQPFGAGYRGGVFVDTADIGSFSGRSRSSSAPDGIMELVVGSGPGIRATVNVYNGQPVRPALLNSFNPFARGYSRGASVARLPSSVPGNVDKILVSAGTSGGSLVETYSGLSKTRQAAFAAYAGSRAEVFTAAINETEIFNVEGQFGRTNGVRKVRSTSGAMPSTLAQSNASYPPLRVAILRK